VRALSAAVQGSYRSEGGICHFSVVSWKLVRDRTVLLPGPSWALPYLFRAGIGFQTVDTRLSQTCRAVITVQLSPRLHPTESDYTTNGPTFLSGLLSLETSCPVC
jgi:hypothetical protein